MYPTRLRSGGEPAGSPSTVIRPPATIWTPTTARISVDLPPPLGPTRPVTVPASTSSERSSSTATPPRTTLRPWTVTAALSGARRSRARQLLVGAEAVLGAGRDERRVSFAQLDRLALHVQHAACPRAPSRPRRRRAAAAGRARAPRARRRRSRGRARLDDLVTPTGLRQPLLHAVDVEGMAGRERTHRPSPGCHRRCSEGAPRRRPCPPLVEDPPLDGRLDSIVSPFRRSRASTWSGRQKSISRISSNGISRTSTPSRREPRAGASRRRPRGGRPCEGRWSASGHRTRPSCLQCPSRPIRPRRGQA